jgi:hypothetical protein
MSLFRFGFPLSRESKDDQAVIDFAFVIDRNSRHSRDSGNPAFKTFASRLTRENINFFRLPAFLRACAAIEAGVSRE